MGKLPEGHWFAGKRVEPPLSGGYLFLCQQCRLKFRHPIHRVDIYDRLYDNSTIEAWPTDSARPDWKRIIQYIYQQIPEGRRVLDFGCYSGGLLAQLSPLYDCYGIEINQSAAALASERASALIWSSVDDVPKAMRFDVVIAADVIEHMPNPMATIERLSNLLNNRGLLIITTGDADNFLWNKFGANWWYCYYPEHIAFISKAWLDYLSQQVSGPSVIQCEKLRYRTLSFSRYLVETIFTCFYGWFPSTFMRFAGIFNKILGRPRITGVPGSGVTADHIFVILSRRS